MKKISFLVFALIAALMSPVTWSETGNSLSKTADQAGQFVTDSTITAGVKADLLTDKDIKSLSISVSTENGVVTLKGKVDNTLEKKKAVEIASKVTGVKLVKDELVISVMPK